MCWACSRRSLTYAGVFFSPRDRNWLEFLSVLDATFSYVASPQALAASPTPSDSMKEDCSKHISRTRDFFLRISEQDGVSDRSALLGLVELEKRARLHGLSTGMYALSIIRGHG